MLHRSRTVNRKARRNVSIGWLQFQLQLQLQHFLILLTALTLALSFRDCVLTLAWSTAVPHRGRTGFRQRKAPIARVAGRFSKASDQAECSEEFTNDSPPLLDLKVLLVDNYDSYTYNLYSYLATMLVEPPVVMRNDESVPIPRNVDMNSRWDAVVLSPGPGNPMCLDDVGISEHLVRHWTDTPILGVCLGHELLGHVHGATVGPNPDGPMHGMLCNITVDAQSPLFQGLSDSDSCMSAGANTLSVVRYHSLCIDSDLPNRDTKGEPISGLHSVAWTTEEPRVCMAVQHTTRPHYGVQFHPESIGSGAMGYRILQNFCHLAHKHNMKINPTYPPSTPNFNVKPAYTPTNTPLHHKDSISSKTTASQGYKVLIHKIPMIGQNANVATPLQVFEALYDKDSGAACAWLDSPTASSDCPQQSRFSILAIQTATGPVLEYHGVEHSQPGFLSSIRNSSTVQTKNLNDETMLAYLKRKLEDQQIHDARDTQLVDFLNDQKIKLNPLDESEKKNNDVPFDWRGGYLGYMSYEMRYDTSPKKDKNTLPASANPHVPTSAFFFADQSLVYDHWTCQWYAIGVYSTNEGMDTVMTWIREVSQTIQSIGRAPMNDDIRTILLRRTKTPYLDFKPTRSKETYQKNILQCHEEIRRGESYELCLTNHLEVRVPLSSSKDPLDLHKILRTRNPAPFSAFLQFGSHMNLSTKNDVRSSMPSSSSPTCVSICCSSPERFLSIRKGGIVKDGSKEFAPPTRRSSRIDDNESNAFWVESKPIKGTCARTISLGVPTTPAQREEDEGLANELKSSIKNRAENLMIVDLLRNDLSRVCEAGSVHVPKLMHIESYATVHQLVSTIRGTLDNTTSCMDVVGACFPGGSMTGAPKIRTMDILNTMEEGMPRGPYSGCLGYLSLNGCMDLNIVIRTAIVTPDDISDAWKVSIGAGGAITALSECEDEYDEMMLKARAIKEAVEEWALVAALDVPQKKSTQDEIGEYSSLSPYLSPGTATANITKL